ncbi:MAG: hypothetical protein ABJB33_05875 [Gemmatimonadota bacterium]
MQMTRLSVCTALALVLAGCRASGTVVFIEVPGADGRDTPVADQAFVVLPYDRDSMIGVIGAPWVASRPDTIPMVQLLDTLRAAYARFLATPPAQRAAAKIGLDRERNAVEARLAPLRAAQHAWQDSAYRSYDSVTFALVKRLARDPFVDTTDATGMTRVAPSRSGPWWVTATAWDATDPYSEWYWNLPLTGDTLRLTAATARHRHRF